VTPTERLQREFFLACFAALDPERATLPVAPRGKPQPSGSCTHAAARPTATDAAGVAEPPPVSAPGGSPTTTLAPGSGAPAGGTSSAEADARVARPNIIAACRGAAEPEVQP
jgi:hypothetical protein